MMQKNKNPRRPPEALADRESPVHEEHFMRECIQLQVFIAHFRIGCLTYDRRPT